MNLVGNFIVAWRGFIIAVKEERNMKIHLAAATVVIALGFNFNITSVEWLIILIMIGLVICTELINSSIENLTDLVTQQKNPLAGKVKDIAASAVLVMSILSIVVGLIIFTKYFKELVA
jgi:diacylglycerol kinase